MGRAGKWLRSFLTGKKERDREKKDDGDRSGVLAGAPLVAEDKRPAPTVTPPPPKEKRRWSFRRSVGGGRDLNSPEPTANAPVRHAGQDLETEQRRHAVAAVAAAAGAAVAAAQAAAAVIRLTAASAPGRSGAVEEASAVKIQSIFRAYLARKALRALKGLVKLQALVRGHLVRKQATATLRCMQALVTAQARARAQRIRMAEVVDPPATPLQRQPTHRRSPLDPRHRSQPYEMERDLEEDIKIVEMDLGESKGSTKSRNSYSITQADRSDHRLSSSSYYGAPPRAHSIPELHLQAATSPSPSALTDMSPRACSGHFEEFSFPTAQSTPHYSSAAVSKLEAGKPPPGAPRQEEHGDCSLMSNDHPLFPNYMANTESSKAKSRSQSAPKQRPEITCERPPSRRRPSVEGRSVPRGVVRMQRSSSHVGSSATNGYQYYPWSLKLDRSSVSLKDSECGSTSTALTNTIYCKSLVSYEVYGSRY